MRSEHILQAATVDVAAAEDGDDAGAVAEAAPPGQQRCHTRGPGWFHLQLGAFHHQDHRLRYLLVGCRYHIVDVALGDL